jgi:hypothetical protein
MSQPRSRIRRIRRRNPSLVALAIVAVISAGIAAPLGVVASHRFSDVPNTNIYHADIDALADAGVTTGCGNGTTFCPSAFVTREQMAAFMNRLGALAAGKTPVVNADKLDGIDSTGFVKTTVQAWREVGTAGQPTFGQWCSATCFDIWSNYSGQHNTAAFYKDPLGVVRLKGLVSLSGSLSTSYSCDSAFIFVLPAGYRPARITVAPTLRNAAPARIDIMPNGYVMLCGPFTLSQGDWWLLDGITFRAAQ